MLIIMIKILQKHGGIVINRRDFIAKSVKCELHFLLTLLSPKFMTFVGAKTSSVV